MADDVNGYVVRWTDDSAPIRASGFLYATEAGNVSTRRERAALFPSIGEALDGARTCDPGRPDRETIFRVYADGREERLPSYEEALDRLGKLEGALSDAARTPLAALAAAEQRLLVSERWTPGDRGFWTDPDDGTQWPKAGALEFVRRKLAAKGSAR